MFSELIKQRGALWLRGLINKRDQLCCEKKKGEEEKKRERDHLYNISRVRLCSLYELHWKRKEKILINQELGIITAQFLNTSELLTLLRINIPKTLPQDVPGGHQKRRPRDTW